MSFEFISEILGTISIPSRSDCQDLGRLYDAYSGSATAIFRKSVWLALFGSVTSNANTK